MREVAAVAGVGVKTVSRVFNQDPHVSAETRARVEAALRQCNYVPNALPTSLRTGRIRVIGIAVPDLLDPFFAAIAKAADVQATTRDLSTVVTSLGADPSREPGLVRSLMRRHLQGLVIAPISPDHSYMADWLEQTPTVFVDRAPVKATADAFLDDDFGGAYQATRHLVEHGCSHIGFVGETPDLPTTRNRLAGYKAALADSSIPVRDELIAPYADDRERTARAVSEFLRYGPLDGIFSCSPRCSMSLVPALRGNDVAVVGFGDFPMADMLNPAFSVIDQDPAEIGRLAVQRLFDRADHPSRRFRRRTVLPVKLIERESCSIGHRDEQAAEPAAAH